MFDRAQMAERHGRILGELAELALSLAHDLHESALAAGTPEAKAELANAFHRISRSARQTLALEARLERDRLSAEREGAAEARQATERRVTRRKDQVRAAVERLIWTEAEDDEAEALLADLDDRLDEEALYDTFGSDPLEAHIARLSEELGLQDPPQGEGDREAVEGVEAHSGLHRPASQPPRSLGDSASGGGASGLPDHAFDSSG